MGEYETMTTLDGVRLDFSDKSWVLIRMSGTEPKVRVYIEGNENKRVDELIEKSMEITKKTAEELGLKLEAPTINRG
ncbi:MAG: hypothetical protein QXD85_05020, partial [Fervidicoccaceae archaeon]